MKQCRINFQYTGVTAVNSALLCGAVLVQCKWANSKIGLQNVTVHCGAVSQSVIVCMHTIRLSLYCYVLGDSPHFRKLLCSRGVHQECG